MLLTSSQAPFPCFTTFWHQNSYPAISPRRPELKLESKSVFITGGGTGIGARIVLSFAEAGAAHIGILARREEKLVESRDAVAAKFPNVKVHIYAVSITDETAVNEAISSFASTTGGKIDVLVSNAAIGAVGPKFEDLPLSSWTESINTNLTGSFIVAQAFLRHAALNAVMINISSDASLCVRGPGLTGYSVSKAATVALYKYIQFERADLRCVSVQPGGVSTPMSRKEGPMVDNASLPGDFCVWLASSEAAFTAGKFLFANWDVDELKARQEEITKNGLLEMWVDGLDRLETHGA